jgi:hypothetical protein
MVRLRQRKTRPASAAASAAAAGVAGAALHVGWQSGLYVGIRLKANSQLLRMGSARVTFNKRL